MSLMARRMRRRNKVEVRGALGRSRARICFDPCVVIMLEID